MRKVLFSITCLFLLASCATVETDKIVVNDYAEEMTLLKNNFPEIYEQYKNGIVVIDKIYTYRNKKTGQRRVKVSYHRAISSHNYYYRFK